MKYNKGFGMVAVILIIIGILVVGGGVYYFNSNKYEKPKEVTNVIEEDLQEEKSNINTMTNKSYTVPGRFSFTYNNAEIEGDPLGWISFPIIDINLSSDSGKNKETISHAKDSSLYNPGGDMDVSYIGNQTFGDNVYEVYKYVKSTAYLLRFSNNESIFIEIKHNSDVPLFIDLASVKLE